MDRRQKKLEKKRRKDKERKTKLIQRSQAQSSALAYHGQKYKRDEYVPVFLATEAGIHEADTILGRRLTDRDVEAALTRLIDDLRRGDQLSPGAEGGTLDETGAIIAHILSRWDRQFGIAGRPPRDVLVGILRTTLGSIEVWSSKGGARGYLNYIKGFLGRVGVGTHEVTREQLADLGIDVEALTSDLDEEAEQSPADDLLEAGCDWADTGDEEALADFRRLADERIRSGRAVDVIDACQRLLADYAGEPRADEFAALAFEAQRALSIESK